eukprot:5369791-Prymnesium_polylepis.1
MAGHRVDRVRPPGVQLAALRSISSRRHHWPIAAAARARQQHTRRRAGGLQRGEQARHWP